MVFHSGAHERQRSCRIFSLSGAMEWLAVFSNSCAIALLSGEVGSNDNVTERGRREGKISIHHSMQIPEPLFFPLEVPWRDIFNCIPVEFLLQLVPGLTRASGNCEWLCLKEGGIFGGEKKSREKISSIGRGTASLHSFVIRLLQIRDSSSSFLTRSLLWRFDCLGNLRGSVCK